MTSELITSNSHYTAIGAKNAIPSSSLYR